MDCNTVTYISAILGGLLTVSELLPHISLTQCNSIMEIILLLFKKKGACSNPLQEASNELQQNNHELTNIIQTIKDEVIIDLRKELHKVQEFRKSLDFKPKESILEQVQNL
jgi:hypothetical protein